MTWTKQPAFWEKLAFLWDRQVALWTYAHKQNPHNVIEAVVLYPALIGDNHDRLYVEITVVYSTGRKGMKGIVLPDGEFSPVWELQTEIALTSALMDLEQEFH